MTQTVTITQATRGFAAGTAQTLSDDIAADLVSRGFATPFGIPAWQSTEGIIQNWDEVFVIGGQSNADGRGVIDASVSKSSPTVYMLDKSEEVRLATEPLGVQGSGWVNNVPSGGTPGTPAHSFGVAMGKSVSALTGIKSLLVPCALGGTSLEQWQIPLNQTDRTTLYGALNYRTASVKNTDRPPVFCWSGHETGILAITESLSTGVMNNSYHGMMLQLVYQLRENYPDAPFIYAQMSTHNVDAATATAQRRAAVQQALLEDNGSPAVETAVAGTWSFAAINANATNTITISGNTVTMVCDGSVTLGFNVTRAPLVAANKTYLLRCSVRGTGAAKLDSGGTIVSSITDGASVIKFDSKATTFAVYRRDVGQPCSLTFVFDSLSEISTNQIPGCYMVVTHDLPRNAQPDGVHLSAVAQREQGRRFALAYAERVLQLPGIDGTGPRLVSVTSTDATHTKVKFTQTLAAAKAGETNYSDGTDSLLRVYDAGTEKAVSAVAIDGADSTALIITHASCSGVRVVTYGDRIGQNAAWRKGVIYNTATTPLPAPMFGPVVSA